MIEASNAKKKAWDDKVDDMASSNDPVAGVVGKMLKKVKQDEDASCGGCGQDIEEMPDEMREEIKLKAARAFDLEDGKTVVVALDEKILMRVDYRCMDKETEVCDDCRLRFSCYSSQYLIIERDKLTWGMDLQETINEKVKAYVERHKPAKKQEA